MASFRPCRRWCIAAVASLALLQTVSAQGTLSRKLSHLDRHGGELQVDYEALPRAGVLVLGGVQGVQASCEADSLQLEISAEAPARVQTLLTDSETESFLASASPVTGCSALQTAPWYLRVRKATPTLAPGAAADGGVKAFDVTFDVVNASHLFEHSRITLSYAASEVPLEHPHSHNRGRSLAWGLDGEMTMSQMGFNYDFGAQAPTPGADVNLAPQAGTPLSGAGASQVWRDRTCSPALERVQPCSLPTAVAGGVDCVGCHGYMKRTVNYEVVTAWGEVHRADFRATTEFGFGMQWRLSDWASPYRVSRTQTILPVAAGQDWQPVFDRILHVGGIPVRFSVDANVMLAVQAAAVVGGSLLTPSVRSSYVVTQGFTYDASRPAAERLAHVRSARRTGDWITSPADFSGVTSGGDAEVTAQLAMGMRVVMGEVLPMASWVVPTLTTTSTSPDPTGACSAADHNGAVSAGLAPLQVRERSRFSLAGVTWVRDEALWPEDLADLASLQFNDFQVAGQRVAPQDMSPEGSAFRYAVSSPPGAHANIDSELPRLVNDRLPGYTLMYHLERHNTLADRCRELPGVLAAGSARPGQLAPEAVGLIVVPRAVQGLHADHGTPSVRVLTHTTQRPAWAAPLWGDGAAAAAGALGEVSLLEAAGSPQPTAGQFSFAASVDVGASSPFVGGVPREAPDVLLEVQSASGAVLGLIAVPPLPIHCAAVTAPSTCTQQADGSLSIEWQIPFTPTSSASGSEILTYKTDVAPLQGKAAGSAGGVGQLPPGRDTTFTLAESDSVTFRIPVPLTAATLDVSVDSVRDASGSNVLGAVDLFLSASDPQPSSSSNDVAVSHGLAAPFPVASYTPSSAFLDGVMDDSHYALLRQAALNAEGSMFVTVRCAAGAAAAAGLVASNVAASGTSLCQFVVRGGVAVLPALGSAAEVEGTFTPASGDVPQRAALLSLAGSRAVGYFAASLPADDLPGVAAADVDLAWAMTDAGLTLAAASQDTQHPASSGAVSSARWRTPAGAAYSFTDSSGISRVASMDMPAGEERLFMPCAASAALAAAAPPGATNIGSFGICGEASRTAVTRASVKPRRGAGTATAGPYHARVASSEVLYAVTGSALRGSVAAGDHRVYAVRLPSGTGRLSVSVQRTPDVCARRPVIASHSTSDDDLRLAQLMLQAAMGGYLGGDARVHATGDWSPAMADLVRTFRSAFDVPQSANHSSSTVDEAVWRTLCALPAAKGLADTASSQPVAGQLGKNLPQSVLGGRRKADNPAGAVVEVTVLDAVSLEVLGVGTSDAEVLDVQLRPPGPEGVGQDAVHAEGFPSHNKLDFIRPAGGSTAAAAGQLARTWFRHGMEAANTVLLVVSARSHWAASFDITARAIAPFVPGAVQHVHMPLHSWLHFEMPLNPAVAAVDAHSAAATLPVPVQAAIQTQLRFNSTGEELVDPAVAVAVVPEVFANPSFLPLHESPAVENDPFLSGRPKFLPGRYPSPGAAAFSSDDIQVKQVQFHDALGAALGSPMSFVRSSMNIDGASLGSGGQLNGTHATSLVFALRASVDVPRSPAHAADFSQDWAFLDFSVATVSFQALSTVDLASGAVTSARLPRGGYAAYTLKNAPGTAGVCLRVVPLSHGRPANPDLVITESTRPRGVALPPYTLARSVNLLDELLDSSSHFVSVNLPGAFSTGGTPSTPGSSSSGSVLEPGAAIDAALQWYDAIDAAGAGAQVQLANGTWAAADPSVSSQWFRGEFGSDIVVGWGGVPHGSSGNAVESGDIQDTWAPGQSYQVASGANHLVGVDMSAAAPWHLSVRESAGGMHAISATPLNEWPVKLSGDLVPLASDPDETTSPAAVEFGGTRLVLELSCDTFVRDAVDMPELRTALVAGMLQDKSLAPHLSLQNLGTLFEHPRGGADVPANPTAMTQPGSWDATVIPALYRSAALGYRLAAKQAAGFFGRSTAIAIGRSLLYDPDGSAGYVKRFNGNGAFDDGCGGRGGECYEGGPGSSLNLDAFVLNPVARLLFKYVAHFTARPHIPDPVNAPTVVTQGFETVVLVASTPAEAQQYVSDCVAAVDSVCFWDRDRALVQAEGAILLAEQAVRERFAGKALNTNQFSALVVQFATSGGSVWPDAHLQETMATGDWSNVCARMMTYINTEASCFDDDLVLQRHLECILFWTPVATPDRDAPTLRFIRDTDASWRESVPRNPVGRDTFVVAHILANTTAPASLSTPRCTSSRSRRALLVSPGYAQHNLERAQALSSSNQAPRALQAAAAPDPTIIVPFWQLEAPPADPSVSSAPTGLRSGVPPVVGAVSYAAPAAGVVHGVNGTLPFNNATAYTDSCGGRGEACGAGGSGSTIDYDRLWTTPRGVELIRHFEGWTPYAFFGAYDPPGMVSIGYGHVIAEHKTARDAHYDGYDFTKEPQMDAWLVDDIGQAEACVRRYAGDVPLNANQFSALVSFVFSLGCHRFSNPATSSLQRALRAGHYDRVCSEFRKWTLSRSGSTIAGGMVKRRHAECILFWTPLGEDPAATQPLHRMPVLFSIQPLLPAGFKPGDAFPAFNLTVDASLSGAASGGALLESSRAYVLAHNASAALNHMASADLTRMYGAILGAPRVSRVFPPVLASGLDSQSEQLTAARGQSDVISPDAEVPGAAVFRRHSPNRLSITLPSIPDFEPLNTTTVTVQVPGSLLTSGISSPALGQVVLVPDGMTVEQYVLERETAQLMVDFDAMDQAASYRKRFRETQIDPRRKLDAENMEILSRAGDSAKTLAHMAAVEAKKRTRRELRSVTQPDGSVRLVEHKLSDAEVEALEDTGARRIMRAVHGRRAEMVWRHSNDLRWGKTLQEATDECYRCPGGDEECGSGVIVKGLTQQLVGMLVCVGGNIFSNIDKDATNHHPVANMLSLEPSAKENPYLQKATADALKKKIEYRRSVDASNRNIKIQVNSALRSAAQQQVLRRWKFLGNTPGHPGNDHSGCGIRPRTPVGSPGRSAHQSGRALDMDHASWTGWKPYFLERTTAAQGGGWVEVAYDPGHFNVPNNFPGIRNVQSKTLEAFQLLWNYNVNASMLRLEVDSAYGQMTEMALMASPADGFPRGAPADCDLQAIRSVQEACVNCDRGARQEYYAFYKSALVSFLASRAQANMRNIFCRYQRPGNCNYMKWDPNEPETPWAGPPMTQPAAGECEDDCEDDTPTSTGVLQTDDGGFTWSFPWSCNTDDGEGNSIFCPQPGWFPFTPSDGCSSPSNCAPSPTPSPAALSWRMNTAASPSAAAKPNPQLGTYTGSGAIQSSRQPLDNPKCHPEVVKRATLLLNRLQEEGMRSMVVDCWRGCADQEAAYRSGASKARCGSSWHQYGLAIDVYMRDSSWDPSTVPEAWWRRYADLSYEYGFTLAGLDFRGSFKDRPHVEFHPNIDGSPREWKNLILDDSLSGLQAAWALIEARFDGGSRRRELGGPAPAAAPAPAALPPPSGPVNLRRVLNTCNGGPAASASASPVVSDRPAPSITPTPIQTDPSACPDNSAFDAAIRRCKCNAGFIMTPERQCVSAVDPRCVPYAFWSPINAKCTCIDGYIKLADGQCANAAAGGGQGEGTAKHDCGAYAYYDGAAGQCQCIGGFARAEDGECVAVQGAANSGGLACPANAYALFSEDGTAGTCVCVEGLVMQGDMCLPCPSNSREVGGVCKCRDGYSRVDGVCAPCPPGSTAVDGHCLCDENFQPTAVGQCARCPEYARWDSDRVCECRGYYGNPDAFVGPHMRGGMCMPPPEGSVFWEPWAPANETHCPDFSSYSPAAQSCFCDDGYYMSGGVCNLCPAHSTEVRGTCVCEPGFVKSPVSGLCVACGQHQVVKGGNCVCVDGYTMINAQCVSLQAIPNTLSTNVTVVCPPNSEYQAGIGMCTCTGPYANFGGQCLPCPDNSHKDGGVCVCNSGFIRDRDAQCIQCPPNSREEDGVCVCSTGYEMTDAGCAPLDSLPDTSSMCGSGMSLDTTSGQCACSSSSQAAHGGTCKDCTQAQHGSVVGGRCECNLGYKYDGAAGWPCEACPPGRRSVDGECGCLPGFVLAHGSCVKERRPSREIVQCPVNAYWDPRAGSCVCATGFKMHDFECAPASTVPQAQSLLASLYPTYECPDDSYFDEKSASCVCHAGHILITRNSTSFSGTVTISSSCEEDKAAATNCIHGRTYDAQLGSCDCPEPGDIPVEGLCMRNPYNLDATGAVPDGSNSTLGTDELGACPENAEFDHDQGRCVCKAPYVQDGNMCVEPNDDAFGLTTDDGSPFTGLFGSGSSYEGIGTSTIPDDQVDDDWWNTKDATSAYSSDDFKWSSDDFGQQGFDDDDASTSLFGDDPSHTWTDDDWGVWATDGSDDTFQFGDDDGTAKFDLIDDDSGASSGSGAGDDQWWVADDATANGASTSDPNVGQPAPAGNVRVRGGDLDQAWPWEDASASDDAFNPFLDTSRTFWGGVADAGSSAAIARAGQRGLRRKATPHPAFSVEELYGPGATLRTHGRGLQAIFNHGVSGYGMEVRTEIEACSTASGSGAVLGFCLKGEAGASPDASGALAVPMRPGIADRLMKAPSRSVKLPSMPLTNAVRVGHVMHGSHFDKARTSGQQTGSVQDVAVAEPAAVCHLPSLNRVVHQLADDVKCLLPEALSSVSAVPGIALSERAADLPLLQTAAWKALSSAMGSWIATERAALFKSHMETAHQAWLDSLPASAFVEGNQTIDDLPPLPLSAGNAAGTTNTLSVRGPDPSGISALLPAWPIADKRAAEVAAEAAAAAWTPPDMSVTTLFRPFAEHASLAMNGLCGLRDDNRVRPKDPEPVDAFGKGYLSQGIAFLAHEDTVAPGAHAALTAHGWARTHVIVEKSTSTASSFAAGTPAQQAFAHGLVQYAFSPKVALSDVYGASILGFQLRWNHNVEQLLGTVNPLVTLGRRRLVEDANPSPGVFSALELVPREGLPRDGACGCPTDVELVGAVRVADAAAGKACLVEKPRAAYPVDKHGAAHWQVQSPSLCGAYARWASKCKMFSGAGSEAPERFSELSGAASRDGFTAASDQSDAMLEASADDFSESNEPNSPTQARKVELEAAGRGLWGEAFEDMPLRHAVQEAKDLRSSISVADAAFSGWKDAQLSTPSTNNPPVDDDVFEGLLEDDDIFEGVPGLPSRRALAEEALRRQVVRNNARNLGLFDWMLGPGDANQPSYTQEDEFAPGETAFEFTTDPHEVNGDQPNAAASTGSAAQPGPFDADFDAAASGPPGGAHYPFDPNQPPQWLAAQGGGWLFGTPDGFDAQDAPAQSSREGSGTADWGFYDYDQAFGTFYSADDGSFFANSFWGVSYTSTQSGAAGQNGNNNCAQTGTGSDPNDPLGDPLFQDDAFAPSDDLYVPNGPQCSPAAGSTGGGSQGGPDRTLPGGGSNGGCPSQYEYKDPQTDTCECVTGYYRQSPTSACEPFQNNRQRPVKDHDPRGVLGVDEVHPEVKRLALRTATLLQNEGYDPYVFEAYRSWARQDQLYNQGGVTQARAGQSWHNYGLAIDLIFYAANGRDPSWAESHPWDRVGALGKQAGFTVWGGDWTSFKDRPHLEYHPGFTGRSRDLIPVYNGQTGSILSKLQAVWTHLSIGVSGSGTTSPSSPPSASTPPAASASSTPAVTPSSTTVANTNHPAFDPRGKLDDPLVHPDVRRMAIETVLDLQAEGYSPYVFECYRSHADQNAAYQRGNSKVTAGGSWHNYGLACDIIFYNSATGRPDWDNGHPWARLGAVGKANGFTEWGGDWKSFFDGPHLQYHPGHRNRARDLQPAYDAAAGNGIEAGIKAAWTFLGVGVDGTAAPSSSPAARRPSPSRTPTSTPAPSSSSTSAPSTTPSPSATPDPSSNSGTTTTGSATCSQGGAASQGLAAYNEDDAKNVRDLCAGRGNNCHSGGCGASTDLSLFSLNDAGLQLILEEEGEAGIFYYGGVKHHCPFIGAADHPWVVTQGYGNVIYHGKGQGDVAKARRIRDDCRSAECCWTDAEARANLKKHVQDKSEATVRRFFSGRTLNANQFSALVSGFFNVGSFAGPGTDSGWPFRSDNYKYVCRGTFNLFVKASGCIARGLVRRRIRECVLFWTPVDEAVNLPNRDTIGARLDPRLPPGQGYPERLTKYYGKGSPC